MGHQDIQDRKELILAITIDQYIQTITPVSSQIVAKRYPLDVSSATVRNILADLEEEGFLTHPHTSAGRIPTQRGYRYYVDHLMNEIRLLEEEKKRIKDECNKASDELEPLIDKMSQILSDATHYTSIISIDGENRIFCRGLNYVLSYSDYQDLKQIAAILEALEQREKFLRIINKKLEDKINVFIGEEMLLSEIDECSIVITQFKTTRGPSGRMAVLGPTRMQYERVISTVNYLSKVIEEIY